MRHDGSGDIEVGGGKRGEIDLVLNDRGIDHSRKVEERKEQWRSLMRKNSH